MLPNLPCDLVDEILFRVPTKSLLRFRSTCRRWKSLFDDDDFAEKQIVNATKQSMFILMSDLRIFTVTCNRGISDCYEVNRCKLNMKECFYEKKGKIFEILQCDGLVFGITKCFNLIVWNPCTKQTKLIEHPEQIVTKPGFAIGCDKKSGVCRYKILMFLECWSNNDPCTNYSKVEMYDFTSNSWRVVDVEIDFLIVFPTLWVSLKGNSYWIGADNITREAIVVRFDFSSEMFGRMSLPFVANPSNEHLAMSVKNDRISVLHKNPQLYEFDIWITGSVRDGEQVSWSKLMRIYETKFGTSFICPYFFIHDEDNKVVVICDEKEESHRICIVEEERYTEAYIEQVTQFTWPILHNFVPSLVRIR